MLWTLFQTGGAHQCDTFTEEYGYRVVAAGRKGKHAFFPKRVPVSIQLFSEIMCNSKKIRLRVGMSSRPLFLSKRLRPHQYSHEKDHKQWLQMRKELLHTTHSHTGALHTGCGEGQKYLESNGVRQTLRGQIYEGLSHPVVLQRNLLKWIEGKD